MVPDFLQAAPDTALRFLLLSAVNRRVAGSSPESRPATGRCARVNIPNEAIDIFCSPCRPNKRRECTGKCRQFSGFGLVQAGSGPRWIHPSAPDPNHINKHPKEP
jgi:hypothetical protein